MGKAFIFFRPSGAPFAGQNFGHVGWGFQLKNGLINVGSVENPGGGPVAHPGKTGFWQKNVGNPFQEMGSMVSYHPRYDQYKVIEVPNFNEIKALSTVEWVSQQGYIVATANCMNYVYHVLTSYGASLPNPSQIQNWVPKDWFNYIKSPPYVLMNPQFPIDISLYQDINGYGECYLIQGNTEFKYNRNLHQKGWGDKVSSIAVRGGYLAVYQDINFGGNYLYFDQGKLVNSLVNLGWNDHVSSYIACTHSFDPNQMRNKLP